MDNYSQLEGQSEPRCRSYYAETIHNETSYQPLSNDIQVDVVIVGVDLLVLHQQSSFPNEGIKLQY